MYTDTRLENDVRTALRGDPRIKRPEQIVIYADEIGSVTLRGAVESVLQRRAAVHTTRKVDGVLNVIDELKVHLPPAHRRADDEIRAATLAQLVGDARVPSNHIDVEVSQGWVTLTGYVTEPAELDYALDDVADVKGVVGVTNEITLR